MTKAPNIPQRSDIELNEQFQDALFLLEEGQRNLFITGKAGTGKSTLLDYFRKNTKKNVVVLAPTGVAALNVSGQTIHSFFGFKPKITLEKVDDLSPSKDKLKIYQNLDTLIIDEVSMVRADLLDCVDKFLKEYGPKKGLPFGGLQMVFIGDLYQLPPVVKDEEKNIFDDFYSSPYFFDAKALLNFELELVELEKIYRQDDHKFIEILNSIRINNVRFEHLETLNSRLNPTFEAPKGDFYVYLTTTNKKAEEINSLELAKLPNKTFTYLGEIWGDFDTSYLPTSEEIVLKKGAQVMMLNNDREKRWVNGTIGKILKIRGDEDGDIIEVETAEGQLVSVTPFTWEISRFRYHDEKKKIISEAIGSFTQYPLKLAWAITIHKSQGKTFDKVVIDLSTRTFAHGQLYVALSRCRSLGGLVLKRSVERRDIIVDPKINRYFQKTF